MQLQVPVAAEHLEQEQAEEVNLIGHLEQLEMERRMMMTMIKK